MEIDMSPEELGDFPHGLVGKFFTNSTPPSLEETESSLRQQWRQILPENMTIQTQNNDLFSLNFKQKKDEEFVLSQGPWVINGVMLIIKKLTNSDEIDFTVTDLYVTVVGLPLYFTKEIISLIQISLGDKTIKITEPKSRILNFKTEIDLKKPLNPGFSIDKTRFVEFKYTNLGDFCYNCGIIGHVNSNCNQIPKERALNATSKTSVYGPWLRIYGIPNWYGMDLKLCNEEKEEDVKECEKTLLYPQFFITLEFNFGMISTDLDSITKVLKTASHSFRFPCSYLDEDSTDLTTSKACEVIENEIKENASFPLVDFDDMHVNWPIIEVDGEEYSNICSLVEYLDEIRKKTEDKWLPLKLEINNIHKLTPVEYQTMLNNAEDLRCVEEIERKMFELMKKKVEEQYHHLDSVSLWEEDIRDALEDIGYLDYPYLFDITARAQQAIREANEMMILSVTGPKPAEREAVEKLECKKVIGSEIDKLDLCVICSLEMFLGEEVTVLPCSHVFHRLSVHEWFRVGHKCPLCGFKLPLRK